MGEILARRDELLKRAILTRRSELLESVPKELAEHDRTKMVTSISKSLDAILDDDEDRAKEGLQEIVQILSHAGLLGRSKAPRGELRVAGQSWEMCIFLCGPYDPKCTFACAFFPKVWIVE
jgi:hypothetical protein